jgi:hypothetical protein
VTSPTDRTTDRREFLGQIAASAIVIAGTACVTQSQATQTAPTPAPAAPPEPTHWDDTWFTRLTAKHKAVFDSPEANDGVALSQATRYIQGMQQALAAGPNDVQVVVVIRHAAIPLIFNDAMWEKYDIGKEAKVHEFGSEKKWAKTNPLSGPHGNAQSNRPQPNFPWLHAHGHIVLGCDLATRGYAYEIAEKKKVDMNTVYDELKTNLQPGVILQPSGVYAVHRAQEAGCTFLRAG